MVPKVVNKSSKHKFVSDMVQKGLETFRIASGSPGNLFLSDNMCLFYNIPYLFIILIILIIPLLFWGGVDWKRKWSGLDWSGGKEGRLVTNPAPKTHFVEKSHNTQFQKQKKRERKAPRGYPIQPWLGFSYYVFFVF